MKNRVYSAERDMELDTIRYLRTQIRIRDSNIIILYVNKKLHGKVVDSTIMSSNTANFNFSPIVSPSNHDQLPTMPAATTTLFRVDTMEPPPPNTTELRPTMHSLSLSDDTMTAGTDDPSLQSSPALMNPVNDYAIVTHYSYGTCIV